MPNRASSDRAQLHLIKASAGSGKTHRLTGDYLRLLFSKENNYRHILAVTFTNKATDEMKSRIVEELYRLSSNASSDYVASLGGEFSMTEKQVRDRAQHILKTILHDYSAFSISTIDRFFQQTMRAFTREMGLQGNYSMEVDETPVLLEAIDLMLSELDRPENKALAEWMLTFMQDRIENGKSWKTDQEIFDLSKQLFNEKYKSFAQDGQSDAHDKKQLEAYKTTLIQIVRSFENELKTIGEKGVNLMSRFGLHYTDFKGGQRSPFSHFVKWANGEVKEPTATFAKLPDGLEQWTTKTTSEEKKGAIESVYFEGLNALTHAAVNHFDNDLFYNSARSILQYFYTLGILNDIHQRMRELQQERNTLFLSDTTELLHRIIGDSDSPFIYEKIGTYLTHYMIDEFQDTSRMQWDNFYPLIRESLASNHINLIVGDVKQSIYRWRNSDWRLLEEQVTRDFSPENVQQHVLDTNWRSDRHIIEFNNAFFSLASTMAQADFKQTLQQAQENPFKQYAATKIKEAYSQVYQHIPDRKKDTQGLVKMVFREQNDDDGDWRQQVLERLPAEIEALQDQGFSAKDIAIVVRWNSEAVEVAETLLRYKEAHPQSPYRYDIISNEALVIANAQSVKAVIAVLRYFRNRNDDTKKMLAVYEYYRFHRRLTPESALALYGNETAKGFPPAIEDELNRIASLPLYEMVEAFFALSKDALDEKENAYVQAFLDIVLSFSTQSSADLNDFLDWWDEKGCRKALFSPDDQDAIRLITIHKSKGLGFDAVLLPFADWTLDHNPHQQDILWCRPQEKPFDGLGAVPLRYSPALLRTIFQQDYLEEKLYSYIDNLNLLYVAFTRAKHQLIVFAPKPKKEENIRSVADLLWLCLFRSSRLPSESTADQPLVVLQNYADEQEDACVFQLGEEGRRLPREETAGYASYKTGKWQSVPFSGRLKLRLNSIGFFSDDGKRDYGKLMHEIVSQVETIGDVPEAVTQKVLSGELREDEKELTVRQLTEVISQPGVAAWYSGRYHVLNETQVLHPRFGFSRPDRVMLGDNEVIVADYKFGEAEDSAYIRQVKRYVASIREMGYPHVKGYVFYVKLRKVIEAE